MINNGYLSIRIIVIICAILRLNVQQLPAGVNSLPNPILFVTQVPSPLDTSTITSVFANHLGSTKACGRGGDLYIMYTNGTLKNLTAAAGYGSAGLQGADGIAVREPSMHWSGTKALFSMIVGSPVSQSDPTQFYWQIYEVNGLDSAATPVITQTTLTPSMEQTTGSFSLPIARFRMPRISIPNSMNTAAS